MSNLYEINEQLLDCIDKETGEILNTEKFDELQIDREVKLENIALWYKNLLSDAEQYKNEEKKFADRGKSARNKAEQLKGYLDTALKGSKFSTVKVNISYRKSSTLEYDGTTLLNNEFWKQQDPVLDKTAITNAIKSGKEILGCSMVEHQNIQIK